MATPSNIPPEDGDWGDLPAWARVAGPDPVLWSHLPAEPGGPVSWLQAPPTVGQPCAMWIGRPARGNSVPVTVSIGRPVWALFLPGLSSARADADHRLEVIVGGRLVRVTLCDYLDLVPDLDADWFAAVPEEVLPLESLRRRFPPLVAPARGWQGPMDNDPAGCWRRAHFGPLTYLNWSCQGDVETWAVIDRSPPRALVLFGCWCLGSEPVFYAGHRPLADDEWPQFPAGNGPVPG